MKQTHSKLFNSSRVFSALSLLAGLILTAPMALADDFELKGDPEAGKQPFQQQCASCHGNTGKGDGPAARAFNPPPASLQREDLTAEHLFLVTRDGGMAHGLAPTMPAFNRSLNEQQIHDVVAYLVSLRDE